MTVNELIVALQEQVAKGRGELVVWCLAGYEMQECTAVTPCIAPSGEADNESQMWLE